MRRVAAVHNTVFNNPPSVIAIIVTATARACNNNTQLYRRLLVLMDDCCQCVFFFCRCNRQTLKSHSFSFFFFSVVFVLLRVTRYATSPHSWGAPVRSRETTAKHATRVHSIDNNSLCPLCKINFLQNQRRARVMDIFPYVCVHRLAAQYAHFSVLHSETAAVQSRIPLAVLVYYSA